MEQFWKKMTLKKYTLLYYDCHYRACVLIERMINILLGIVSTGSIVGIIATDKDKLMFYILGITQIFTAAKPYFPYTNRIKELDKGMYLLDKAYTKFESYWQDVSNGKFTESKINKLIYDSENEWKGIERETLKDDVLPNINLFVKKAEKATELYFENL